MGKVSEGRRVEWGEGEGGRMGRGGKGESENNGGIVEREEKGESGQGGG